MVPRSRSSTVARCGGRSGPAASSAERSTSCSSPTAKGRAFRSVYQPIVTLADTAPPAVVGYEALLRAQSATSELMPEAMFAAAGRPAGCTCWTGSAGPRHYVARPAGWATPCCSSTSCPRRSTALRCAWPRRNGRRAGRAAARPARRRGDRERAGQRPRPPGEGLLLLPGARVQGGPRRPGRRVLLVEHAGPPETRHRQARQGDSPAVARAGQPVRRRRSSRSPTPTVVRSWPSASRPPSRPPPHGSWGSTWATAGSSAAPRNG